MNPRLGFVVTCGDFVEIDGFGGRPTPRRLLLRRDSQVVEESVKIGSVRNYRRIGLAAVPTTMRLSCG